MLAAPTNLGLTAAITGRPAVDGIGHTWFLTEDGKVFRYDDGAPSPFLDFRIKDTSGMVVGDSFLKSELTLYATGGGGDQVGMVASANGNFFSINMTPGSPDYGKTIAMVFLDPVPTEVGHTPPVWFDNYFGVGAFIEAYVCSNNGVQGSNRVRLHRFVINRATAAVVSHLVTTLGDAPTAAFTEFQQSPPIVWGQKLSLATTRWHSTNNPNNHRGYFRQIDLSPWIASNGATPPTTSPMVMSLNSAVKVSPSIELDWNTLFTHYAFVPSGNTLNFYNVANGHALPSTNGLVLGPNDPPGDSGDVANYFGEEIARRDNVNGGILTQPEIHAQPGTTGSYCVTVLNSNALWKISLPYSGDAQYFTDTSPAADAAREAAWTDNFNWTYCKTRLGSTMGTVDGAGKYIANPCLPAAHFAPFGQNWPAAIGNEDRVIFMDNFGGPTNSSHVVAQVFNVNNEGLPTDPPEPGQGAGLIPSFTGDLHMTPPPAGVDLATELAGGTLVYNLGTNTGDTMQFLFHTSSHLGSATPSAALWSWVAPLN